ncbi:MAG: hypothetical protein K0Q72_941 [Armatimonadetes bacterium]|jgi:hypothetical protein|nr:hypothetical protein [Armatimonadota bacterium]
MIRPLSLLAVAACLAAPVLAADKAAPSGMMGMNQHGPMVYGMHERKLPDAFYKAGYRLTPRDYAKYRAAGYSRDEVFLIANAARATGIDPGHFAQMITNGNYARQISLEHGISPNKLTHVMPEWRTREWAAAVNEPTYERERLNVWW